jgi:signal transduction histidine kinase
MPSLPELRRLEELVRLAAVAVGLLVAVAVPTAYLSSVYIDEGTHRAFQARLSAARLSKIAYVQGPAWRYSTERMAEIISIEHERDERFRQRVYDATGALLLTTGTTHSELVLVRSAPIIVGTQQIGRVDVEASLQPILLKALLAAATGLALGAAAYLAVHNLPVRVLRRTLAALQQTQGELRRQVEETTRAYADLQRQHRVTEETAEELTRAIQRAELANRTKSEFLANVSHELRTPLNAVIGFSEIIMNQRFGPNHASYKDYAADIHNSGSHLLSVINDILDISKIEAGKLELHEEAVDLVEIVAACHRLIAERALRGGVSLIVEPPAGKLPTVRADATKLKQVVLNLVSNAVKFTPAGGTVTVSTTAPADQVCIEVRDTGIGMTTAEIDVALQPFRQVDNSHTRKYQGTGLGLPLAKGLIEAHGGKLEITSEPGVGTTMRVLLPLRAKHSAAA